MPQYHTQRLTAAAALTPPKPGMYLVMVRTIGGATYGTYSFTYDGVSNAHFISPSNGTSGFAEYVVSFPLGGTNIPAASMAFNGGLSVVELIYSDAPGSGPPMSSYRAIRQARTDAGATTANITTNFDAAPGVPKKSHVGISASNGRVKYNNIGPYQLAIEADPARYELGSYKPVSDIPPANSITLSVITDGAATIQHTIFY